MGLSALSYRDRRMVWQILFFTLLEIAGTYIQYVNAIAFILCLLFVIRNQEDENLYLMAYVVHFSQIFKINIQSFSLYNILLIVVVLFYAVRRPILSCGRRVFGWFMVFSGLTIAISFPSGIKDAVTIICALLFIIQTMGNDECEIDYKKFIYSSTAAVIVTTVMGYYYRFFPSLSFLEHQARVRLSAGNYYYRFAGMTSNPNFYSVFINLLIAAFLVLIVTKRGKKIDVFLCILMCIFGFLSISMSFIVAFAVTIGLIILCSVRNQRAFIGFCAAAVIVAIIIVNNLDNGLINAVLFRIQSSDLSTSDASTVTSGRWGIWTAYITELLDNPLKMFFGHGVGVVTTNNRQSHNMYLEMLFYTGVVGTISYWSAIIGTFRNRMQTIRIVKGKLIYYVPLLIFLVRALARNMFTSELMMFYIFISFLCISNPNIDNDDFTQEK